ncbi:tail fiber chaperone [Salmonella phage vB_SnwM_CGG4-1]|uniref:57A chaperone for long tail fiber formation n=1 Tax=Salmonella phage vB_SnwM_CGG4-1 TaxID=1815631 RepID=A0A1B0VVI6_9CAUD|nr:tail fiber chaperone [Salmonella phage vB_SnwM_CGG4-1]ANA49483.1 57A chaperone for long tail fiber formation [Salmonella phage vB_SnwM_CGG4-1]
MTDKIKQLEATVTVLKARLFDLNEQFAETNNTVQSLNDLVSKIVEKIGLEVIEGQVTFEAILEKIDELTATPEVE